MWVKDDKCFVGGVDYIRGIVKMVIEWFVVGFWIVVVLVCDLGVLGCNGVKCEDMGFGCGNGIGWCGIVVMMIFEK